MTENTEILNSKIRIDQKIEENNILFARSNKKINEFYDQASEYHKLVTTTAEQERFI